MNIKTTPIVWTGFFLVTIFILAIIAWQFIEPAEITVSDSEAKIIGQKIWLNEGAGKLENLVVWNLGEDFPSMGIGHFIWYPEGVEPTFQESFPGLLKHISKTKPLPDWLQNTNYPPWQSREEFLMNKHSKFTTDLRAFLLDTFAEQTQYIIIRLEKALPDILKEIKNPFSKRVVRENFYHIAMQENGVYALVDYVNFKGEGTSVKERYNNYGWGLAQVLEHMDSKADNPLQAFVDSANAMLYRRVENAPRDESRWLPGWRKRLQTYVENSN